jgi:hypothetical protein
MPLVELDPMQPRQAGFPDAEQGRQDSQMLGRASGMQKAEWMAGCGIPDSLSHSTNNWLPFVDFMIKLSRNWILAC